MSSRTGRFRWQPPLSTFHAGVSRSCQRRTRGSGDAPCSTNKRRPPRRSTRRISARASGACGIVHSVQVITTGSIVHSVQVITTGSTLPLSSGISSAEASTNATGTAPRGDFRRARAITLRTRSPYNGRFNPEPEPTSSTRPSAAPITRRRYAACGRREEPADSRAWRRRPIAARDCARMPVLRATSVAAAPGRFTGRNAGLILRSGRRGNSIWPLNPSIVEPTGRTSIGPGVSMRSAGINPT